MTLTIGNKKPTDYTRCAGAKKPSGDLNKGYTRLDAGPLVKTQAAMNKGMGKR